MKRSTPSRPTVFLAVSKPSATSDTIDATEERTPNSARHVRDPEVKRDETPSEPLQSFLKKKEQMGTPLATRPRSKDGRGRIVTASSPASLSQNTPDGAWKTLPPHMRTIARYLMDQFQQKPVSILTQGGRFQGVFSGFDGTQIKLHGVEDISLPLSSVMSVAHAANPESLRKAP
ncbi:hypothetical protein [Ferroacidibacillus organovorans]|uniref:Uncharacterized protein n=1 Tax=Ferroacidibacillus organovorans TaxID=1765683 RepID=A0A1V4EQN8_9BACL|nr:hypothetical protein [Ferroacidibacillus organovorans]OPG15192.1 hypothetical protein B2M26_13675 [Ferroacidibacillus organovorans]